MSAPRELRAHASRDEDSWWTITIPELTSPGPSGRPIVATGAATNHRSIEQAARELATAWLDDDAVRVTVQVDVPDGIAQLWHDDGTEAEETAREA